MKYDSHGIRKTKHHYVFPVRETHYEWKQTQRLIKEYEMRFGAKIVKHPRGIYLYSYHDDPNHALAVCEYVDFSSSKERDILTAFCEWTRMGKLAFYALLNHVMQGIPLGWQAAGFVAWNHEPMRRMIEQAGFEPKLVMYTKEII